MSQCGVSDNEYSCTHGAQINFGDLIMYLTCDTLTLASSVTINTKTIVHGSLGSSMGRSQDPNTAKVAWGRRGKDYRKQNTLAPLILENHACQYFPLDIICV
jgi:hypothetical protein